MRVKNISTVIICDGTWDQRSNKQICCLAYNYGLKTGKNLTLSGLECLTMFLQCTNYTHISSSSSSSSSSMSRD